MGRNARGKQLEEGGLLWLTLWVPVNAGGEDMGPPQAGSREKYKLVFA